MWQLFKTIIFVSLATVLLWLYAEAENVNQQTLLMDVLLVPRPGRELLIEPAQHRVEVTFRGATAQLARVPRLPQPLKLEVYDDLNSPVARQEVRLAEKLAAHPGLAALGVSIVSVTPGERVARVEAIQTREGVPIRVMPRGDVQLAPSVVIQPKTATLRYPASYAGRVDDMTMVEARIDPAMLPTLAANVQYTVDARLLPPEWLREQGVSVEPETAQVKFTIAEQTRTMKLPSIPVVFQASGAAWERNRPQLDANDQFIHDVVIKGPSETIERIESGKEKVKAVIELTAEELERRITSKVPEIHAPAGVTVESTLAPKSLTYKPGEP